MKAAPSLVESKVNISLLGRQMNDISRIPVPLSAIAGAALRSAARGPEIACAPAPSMRLQATVRLSINVEDSAVP